MKNSYPTLDELTELKMAEKREAAEAALRAEATVAAQAEIAKFQAAERAEEARVARLEQQAEARVAVQEPLARIRTHLEAQPALYLRLLEAWKEFEANVNEGKKAQREARGVLFVAGIIEEFEEHLTGAGIDGEAARSLKQPPLRLGFIPWSFANLKTVGMPGLANARDKVKNLVIAVFGD